MLKRTSIVSLVSASAVTICSTLALSTAFAADFPTGSYAANGLVLTFDTKGTFHANQGKETKVSGTYSVSGDQVKLTDLAGPWACKKPGQKTGTYSWKFDSGALTLSKVADSCDERAGSLTPSSWKPQK